MIIGPTDLPLLRAETLRYLKTQVVNFPEDRGLPNETKAVQDFPRQMGDGLLSTGWQADLFYVSEEMTELAKVAVETLPDFTLEAFDVIGPSGYIVFDRPIAQLPASYSGHGHVGAVRGAMWHMFENQGFGALAYLVDTSDWFEAGAPRNAVPRLCADALSFFILGGVADDQRSQTGAYFHVQATLKTAWLLMRQPISIESKVDLDRNSRRRLKRADVEPASVRVIKLRHQSSAGTGSADRDYHHRWIVRGHWRQQWYPSLEVHRPVWISPHVKGPDGAPLLGGEKVHAWTR